MDVITIAFDVDGTLLDEEFQPIEENRQLLVLLSRMRNVRIHLWSGSGEMHAHRAAELLGVAPYVHSYSSKIGWAYVPDITVDDVATTRLGVFNLITGDPDVQDD